MKLVLLILTLIGDVLSLECFKACFDCLESGVCEDHCGFNDTNMPGFVPVTCSDPDDVCVWLEHFIERQSNNNLFSITSPFGCLNDVITEQNSYLSGVFGFVHFELEMTLFTCTGEFCNEPAVDTSCNTTDSQQFSQLERSSSSTSAFRESTCFITGNEFDQIRDNRIRFGNIAGALNLTQRCIDFTNFEIDQLGLRQLDLDFNGNSITEREILSCNDCRERDDCNPTDPETPPPTTSPTITPTSSPETSLLPTRTPTINPTSSPETSLSPTKTPTINPTSSPETSLSPTASPIFTPTVSPTFTPTSSPETSLSPSASPIFTPTRSPETSLSPTGSPVFTDVPTSQPTEEDSDSGSDDDALVVAIAAGSGGLIMIALAMCAISGVILKTHTDATNQAVLATKSNDIVVVANAVSDNRIHQSNNPAFTPPESATLGESDSSPVAMEIAPEEEHQDRKVDEEDNDNIYGPGALDILDL